MKVAALVFCFGASGVLALGPGGQVGDLLWPTLNLTLLLFLLRGKVLGALAGHLASHGKEVEELYDFAEKKDKEAQIRLEIYQKKMAHLDTETERRREKARREEEYVEKETQDQTKARLSQLEEKSRERILREKKALLLELRDDLVAHIVREVKGRISSDKASRVQIDGALLAKSPVGKESVMRGQEALGPWAKAYGELAREEGIKASKEWERLESLVESSDSLRRLLLTGPFTPEEQVGVLEVLAPKIPLSKTTAHFLSFLLEQKRASLLPLLFREIPRLEDEALGLVRGELLGAGPEDQDGAGKDIEAFLEDHLQKKVKLTYKQEATVTAGYRAQVDHLLFDISLDAQLERFQMLTHEE